jgi:hypothetical protein
MKVQSLLVHKLNQANPAWGHRNNQVTDEYWAPAGWVAFRDELGLLWLDHPDLDEAHVSSDDDHPSPEKPLLYNESAKCWIGIKDSRGEWYRLGKDNGECFILCSGSRQHSPGERELSVIGYLTADGEFKLGQKPAGEWIAAEPTPHHPRVILVLTAAESCT